VNRPPITHVAIRFEGCEYSLPSPNRHHDVIRLIVDVMGVEYVDAHGDDQGFLDAEGRYLTRAQAMVNASLHDQLRADRPVYYELYSENLW
jgi:hypothetical protein